MNTDDHLFISINYKTANEIAIFLDSLLIQQARNWQLIIKDNSEDPAETERLQALTADLPRVSIHDANDNVGYFGAANEVLRSLDPSQYLTVSVCNSDVSLVSDSFIDTLNDCTKLDDDTLVVAPNIHAVYQGVRQNPYMRKRPSVLDAARRRLYFFSRKSAALIVRFAPMYQGAKARMGLGLKRSAASSSDRACGIYAPHGSFIVFRREFFLRGNDFSHPLFLFGEELTVAERVVASSGRVLYYPDLRIDHREHASMGGKKSTFILDAMVKSGKFGIELYVLDKYRRLASRSKSWK